MMHPHNTTALHRGSRWFALFGYILLWSTEQPGSVDWFGYLLILFHVWHETWRSDVQ